jgi:hypothetical protein
MIAALANVAQHVSGPVCDHRTVRQEAKPILELDL